MIVSIKGTPASPLGLAAHPDQDPRCIGKALESGINFVFFYSPGLKSFVDTLRPFLREHREEIILASGSGARTRSGLRAALRKVKSGDIVTLLVYGLTDDPGRRAQRVVRLRMP